MRWSLKCLMFRTLMGLAFALEFVWLGVAVPVTWVAQRMTWLSDWAEIRWLLARVEKKVRR